MLVTVGGIIPDDDVAALKEAGVAAVFGPGHDDRRRSPSTCGRTRDRATRVGRVAPAGRPDSPGAVDGAWPTPRSRGDRRALARLLTAVENRTPVAEAALRRLYPLAGEAHLVGITGPPGVGQVDARRGADRRGPARPAGRWRSSRSTRRRPITGGALLGDRVRMQAYAGDRDVFIRSMAARGHAGGLASTSTAAAAVLDAAGFDLVLIETVGTGQSEVEVAAAADTTVVLEAPEMGDEVQAIKAGLLEVADLVVVNKGDRPGAQRTAAQLRAMLVAGGVARRAAAATRPAAAEAARGPRHDRLDRRGRPASCSRRWTAIAPLGRRADGARGAASPSGGAGLGDPRGPTARPRCAEPRVAATRRARRRRRGAPTGSVRRRRPLARPATRRAIDDER